MAAYSVTPGTRRSRADRRKRRTVPAELAAGIIVSMGRPLRVIIAVGALAAGVGGCVVVLTGQGLDRAEKWVSIFGVVVSVVVGSAGLALGWLTLKQGRSPSTPQAARSATASGAGAVAVGGHSNAEVATEVSGALPPATASPALDGGTLATGAGSVAIGGNNAGPILTRVTRPGQAEQP
jgi:hypothetical protein